jgi:PRC-barrel domain
MVTLPAGGVSVTSYYKQNVYDPSDNKIGEIADLLVTEEGRITAVIISVRIPRHGREGHSRAVRGDPRDAKGQQKVVLGYEYDQGCLEECTRLQ